MARRLRFQHVDIDAGLPAGRLKEAYTEQGLDDKESGSLSTVRCGRCASAMGLGFVLLVLVTKEPFVSG